ncbi:hypothetical protein [Ottowia testudinis]|uniref:Uncharacterized protein n=1 Tax=Ottowia testudinis TaxID=2816950 RepID=A0A975CGH2_9BURK|nr:hypothetical protein [Ottowia testudinis]QTD43724.1 hypothetical protein J1M35_11180 [Ottowia testudinis]
MQAAAPALNELAQFLAQHAPAKTHTPIDPKNLPWSSAKATPRLPAETPSDWAKKLAVKATQAKPATLKQANSTRGR